MTTTVQLPTRVEGRHLPRLRRALLDRLRVDPDLVLACADVELLSPAGAALLVLVARAARRRGGRLHLEQPSAAVTAALGAAGLGHLLASPVSSSVRPT